MAASSIYATGTISVSANDTALIGVGTSWADAGVLPGALIFADALGRPLIVRSVTSNTVIMLDMPAPAAVADAAYVMLRRGSDARLVELLSRLLAQQSAAFDLDGEDKSLTLTTDSGELWHGFATETTGEGRWRFGIAAGDFDTFRIQRYNGSAWIDILTADRSTGITTMAGVDAGHVAGVLPSTIGLTILGSPDDASVRDAIGLGSAATRPASDFAAPSTTLAGYGIADAYTRAETDDRIQSVVGAAPAALDTLQEIGARLVEDENTAAALTTVVSTKLSIADAAATIRATVLTGLSTVTAAAISATDSILVALGKLQALINTKAPKDAPVFTSAAEFQGNLKVNKDTPVFRVNRPSPSDTGSIVFSLDDIFRWKWVDVTSAQWLALYRYDALGVVIDRPITVSIATGAVTFSIRPMVGTSGVALQSELSQKLDIAAFTTTAVVNLVKAADGAGSGLDADLLRNTTPTVLGLALLSAADATAAQNAIGFADAIESYLANLPTTLPPVSGRLWNNGGSISIS